VIVPPKTVELLASLNGRVKTAVISGRSLRDIGPLLAWKPHHVIGNHGLEGLASRNGLHRRAERICRGWVAQLEHRQKIRMYGVFIEDKQYTLALHYRGSTNKHDARQALFGLVNGLHPPPRLILGKSVINLIPPGSPHKGVALLELMLHSNVRAAFYIGDDDTDEDVFALPEEAIVTVRVGYKRDSQAHFFIERQSEVNRLLLTLHRYLSP
jgi:trehalose 6-phosphate phosphatase